MDWSEYREHGTEFIKASTSPDSIAEQLKKVYNLPQDKVREMGAAARQWVIDNFSINEIGKKIEDFADSVPFLDKEKVYSIKNSQNPEAVINSDLPDGSWLISMYKDILDMDVDDKDQGYK